MIEGLRGRGDSFGRVPSPRPEGLAVEFFGGDQKSLIPRSPQELPFRHADLSTDLVDHKRSSGNQVRRKIQRVLAFDAGKTAVSQGASQHGGVDPQGASPQSDDL